jgi:hypothetical protein
LFCNFLHRFLTSKTKELTDEEIHPIVVELIRTITEKIQTRRNTAAVVQQDAIDSVGPTTGSISSVSDAGTSPAPDDPSKQVVELIQDPVTRRPTIIIKPAVQTVKTSTTLQQNPSAEKLTKTIRYTAKHPHMGPVMVTILRAMGFTKEKAYAKVVKWGLFTLE